jgi:hypothetical protein
MFHVVYSEGMKCFIKFKFPLKWNSVYQCCQTDIEVVYSCDFINYNLIY